MFDQEIKMDICPGSEEPIILEHLHLEPGEHDTDDSELRTSYETYIIEGRTVHRCMVCQYCSSIITNMKRHVRTHTGAKPFSCPHCGQREIDASESRASYQTQIIEGHIVHCCIDCQYRSCKRSHMNRHEKIHTGERPFSCPHFGQRFTQKEHALRHISTVHV
ncbi:hypothetical protein AVEN_164378-1 [Araneus ventricosus]|uniref:C2H2-type domain-containing protein n=1 Tax=Araneus ventricosus TaxID=182803 RepID=A0A4Y2GFH5_ARAVE|nr:hypothetical protein AVEN_164378-1 [Araneus ventricosus]